MAFFDDLGKMLSTTSQNAIQKTKELAEISRLNSGINELERMVNNNYCQVGRLYAALHPDDYESDFSGLMSTIAEGEAKIREMKSQIMALKGLVKCENCGAEVSAQATYCDGCGAEMPRKKELEDMVRCDSCGAYMPKESKFCKECGMPFPSQENESAPKEGAKAPNGICPICGAPLKEGASFCSKCGYRL